MATTKLTTANKEEIRNLYASGEYSYSQLAAKYKVSITTIMRCINDPTGEQTREKNKNYYKKNSDEINLRAMEINREFRFKLNKKNDAALIAFLEGKENFRQYILDLIRVDMETSKQKEKSNLPSSKK